MKTMNLFGGWMAVSNAKMHNELEMNVMRVAAVDRREVV